MLTRIIECFSTPSKVDEMRDKVRNELLPKLHKQPGSVDLIALCDNREARRMILLSFWNAQQNTEGHHREHYDVVLRILGPVLEGSPTFESLKVETSTVHRLAAAA